MNHKLGREDWEMNYQEEKGGEWVVLSQPAPRLPSSALYQPVLSGANTSKVKNFEGLTLSTYTLERWGNIFQILEEEAQKTPMMSPDGITRAKGEEVKVEK